MYLFVPYLPMNVFIIIFFSSIYGYFCLSIVLTFFVNILPKFAPWCLEYDYTYLPDSGPIC